MDNLNIPPVYGESLGPIIVASHILKSSIYPALQLNGGFLVISSYSLSIRSLLINCIKIFYIILN